MPNGHRVERESELYDLSMAFRDKFIDAINDVGRESDRSMAITVECMDSMAE